MKINSRQKNGFLFILRFLGAYFFCYLFYQYYLNLNSHQIDPYTFWISNQVDLILKIIGYQYDTAISNSPRCLGFWRNNLPIFGIVEGCNGTSVIMLFLSFIFAFKGPLRKMIVFMISGALFLALVNLIRIVILGILYIEYPEYTDVLHDVVFPLGMYGLTLFLWIIWIKLTHGKKT